MADEEQNIEKLHQLLEERNQLRKELAEIRDVLKLAGKLALAAQSVMGAPILSLSNRIELLGEALQHYDQAVLALSEKNLVPKGEVLDRKKWTSDKEAIDFLEKQGYKLRSGFTWQKPTPEHKPTMDENAALDYLWLEWDFGDIDG